MRLFNFRGMGFLLLVVTLLAVGLLGVAWWFHSATTMIWHGSQMALLWNRTVPLFGWRG